jgi:hypothetical protein
MADIGLVMASAVGAFAGGGLGAGASVVVARSRENGARREEWFRRFQYVSALVLADTDRERDAGFSLLRVLVTDPLAGPGERRLGETLLAEVLETGELGHALSRYGVEEQDLLRPDRESIASHAPLDVEDNGPADDGEGESG